MGSTRFRRIKRWSTGVIVDNFEPDTNYDKNTFYFTGTTADALSGNSGGPALLEDGSFFGVVKSSASRKDNDFVYSGNEQDPMDWSRCEYMQDFMSGRALSFKAQVK